MSHPELEPEGLLLLEGEDREDRMDLGLGALFFSPPAAERSLRREPSLERPQRLRRSRRTASDGGSPLAGGLPYTGRRFCEYN